MSDSQGTPLLSITNEGGRVGVQAGHYVVHGDNIIQTTPDQDPLKQLPHAVEASFNSYMKRHDPTCLPDTRVDLLHKIHSWTDGQDKRTIFWLSGLAGTGKSTIARTIAETQSQRGRLGASFFFSRGGGDVSHAGKFVTSLASQLADSIPNLRQHICNAIRVYSDIASRSLREQWHQLILRPLSKLDGTGCQKLYIIVVDALDECSDEDDIRVIVHLLAEARSLEGIRLQAFLTSRPEIPVRHGFGQIADQEHEDFVLHNMSPSIVDHDISIFLEYNLGIVRRERSLAAGWPGEEIIRQLVEIACGLFIWAATACRFIREGKRFAAKRLDTILKGNSGAVTEPNKHLDEIYTTVLSHSVSSEYTDEEKGESYGMLRQILGSIVVLFSPLSAHSLPKLLHKSKVDIDQTLEDLHSILEVPGDKAKPLRLHHPSFRDFLLDKDRCQEPELWVDEQQAHQMLVDSCLQLLSIYLKKDICEVNAPGMLAARIKSSQVEQFLFPELQYACLYWVRHLEKSGAQLRDDDQVHHFLQKHLLHWLEALGWMGKVSEGVYAIAFLESFASSGDCPGLSAFIYDTKRFILFNRPVIEQAPLQVYYGLLMSAPMKSIVRQQFIRDTPLWIRSLQSNFEENWNALLQTLEGHSDRVRAVAFSPDGKQLASASDDSTIKLWDARSGMLQQTLQDHSDWVNAVAFSPDSKQLASVSGDSTVKLWDAKSGALQQTLKGHSDSVNAIAFSPSGTQLASTSGDTTIKLWDARSGVLQQTLYGHSYWVNAVAFSPDSKQLVSASSDSTVKLWDTGSGALQQTLQGHSYWVNAVAFSPDGKQLALASSDSTIKLWDVRSGALRQTLHGHSYSINSVVFSPDGKQLVSASGDKTVKLWDAGSGVLQQTLDGHWDAGSGLQQKLEGHSDSVNTVAFSPDGQQLTSASSDGTIKLWDAGSKILQQTLEGHSSWINAVALSPDGQQLASASGDSTVKLWDTGSGALQQTLQGHSSSVNAVAFSLDGKQLASASDYSTVKLWDVGSGALQQTLKVHSDWARVNAVAFSPDGKQLASGSGDSTVKLWNARSGVLQQILQGHSGWVNAVAFSPDSKQLASASGDSTVKLWDAGSGVLQQTLQGHSKWVNAIAFSLDSKQLASASGDGTVKLWDAKSGALQQTFQGHSDSVSAVAFSPDGQQLALASGDSTIELWNSNFK